ncbi:MAG: glycosyltransferase family 2 protein [Candidatus Eremiobacteraeota bacterium]|nr:glycosyltransferase family 2 protein [Candidatus Eremiobacteraeota bacterium]
MAHSVLQADASSALEMLDFAARLRTCGNTFDLALRLDDDRGSVAAVLAQNVCRMHPVMNPARLAALDSVGSPEAAIGENPLLRFATMDIATKATIRDLAALADSLIFRSWAEMRRGVMDYDILHRSYTIAVSKDTRVPPPQGRKVTDGSIVIWAPDESVERLYIVLTAAAQTARPVRVIAKPGDLAGIPAEVVALEDAAAALARAAVCVVATLSDPSAVSDLAAWNIPICATFTSGAQEVITPVSSYRSWSRASALSAITQALAMPAPRHSPSSAQYTAASQPSVQQALVTIIVRSQGGIVCEATQRSLDAQTHHSHEIAIADSAQGVHEALSQAKGSYVLFINDGDILFSDHLAALVDALEQSNEDIAYAGSLLCYVMDAPGPPTVLGYSVMETFPVLQRAFSALDQFSGTYFRVLFRSERLRLSGLCAELDALAVFDVFSRILAERDAIHVNRVSGMSIRFLDGRQPGTSPRSYRAEYEAYYRRQPVFDADIGNARAAVLQHLLANPNIGLRPPPQRLSPPRPF